MKKLLNVLSVPSVSSVLCIICILFVLSGCMTSTTTIKTISEFDIPTGKVVKQTTTTIVEKAGPLKGKMITMGISGYCFEITTAVDPSTGMIMPTVKAAGGDSFFADMPVIAEGTPKTYYEYFYLEKSLWNNSAAVARYVRSSGGLDSQASIKINVDLNKISAPGTVLDNVVPAVPK